MLGRSFSQLENAFSSSGQEKSEHSTSNCTTSLPDVLACAGTLELSRNVSMVVQILFTASLVVKFTSSTFFLREWGRTVFRISIANQLTCGYNLDHWMSDARHPRLPVGTSQSRTESQEWAKWCYCKLAPLR
jgi:hypothetical protein